MRRRLFNLLALLSLLVCMATAALWVRCAWVAGTVVYFVSPSSDGVAIDSWEGAIGVVRLLPSSRMEPGWHFRESAGLRRNGSQWSHPPVGFFRPRWGGWNAYVYDWLIVLITVVMPSIWLIARLSRRRQRGAGLCTTCGYDLRATPDRCPECGTGAKPQPAEGAAA